MNLKSEINGNFNLMTTLRFVCLPYLRVYDENRNLEEEIRYPTGEPDLDELALEFISDIDKVNCLLVGFENTLSVTQYQCDNNIFHVWLESMKSLSAKEFFNELREMSPNISIDDNVDLALKICKIYNIRDNMESEIDIRKLLSHHV